MFNFTEKIMIDIHSISCTAQVLLLDRLLFISFFPTPLLLSSTRTAVKLPQSAAGTADWSLPSRGGVASPGIHLFMRQAATSTSSCVAKLSERGHVAQHGRCHNLSLPAGNRHHQDAFLCAVARSRQGVRLTLGIDRRERGPRGQRRAAKWGRVGHARWAW